MTEPEPRKRRPLVSLAELATPKEPRGMLCRNCGCNDLRTTETRKREGGYVYRRKACRNCGELYTSTERIIG